MGHNRIHNPGKVLESCLNISTSLCCTVGDTTLLYKCFLVTSGKKLARCWRKGEVVQSVTGL